MKRILLGLVGGVLVLALIGYTLRTQIVLRMMDRLIAANLQTDLMQELPDGLYVALCGAGSPLPDPNRSGPCTAVIAGDQLYVVDSGAGSSKNPLKADGSSGTVQTSAILFPSMRAISTCPVSTDLRPRRAVI